MSECLNTGTRSPRSSRPSARPCHPSFILAFGIPSLIIGRKLSWRLQLQIRRRQPGGRTTAWPEPIPITTAASPARHTQQLRTADHSTTSRPSTWYHVFRLHQNEPIDPDVTHHSSFSCPLLLYCDRRAHLQHHHPSNSPRQLHPSGAPSSHVLKNPSCALTPSHPKGYKNSLLQRTYIFATRLTPPTTHPLSPPFSRLAKIFKSPSKHLSHNWLPPSSHPADSDQNH